MAKLRKQVNYAKLVDQAKRTKMEFPKAKKKAYENWQKKLGSKSKKLDKIDDRLRKGLQELAKLDQENEDFKKALTRLLRMMEGSAKELQTYTQIPTKEKLPEIPKNTIGIQSIALVMVGMIAYVAAVKAYMAVAEVISSKD